MKDDEVYVRYGSDFGVTYAVQVDGTSACVRDMHSFRPGGIVVPRCEICIRGLKYRVTRISERVCGDNWTTEVVLPSSIEEISDEAFRFSSGLKQIDLPEGLRHIGGGAFELCEKLESITIPSSVEEIGSYCFYRNCQLREIIFSNPSSSHLKKIGGYSFIDCDMLEYIELPDSVECIEDFAFAYCENLRHVILPMRAHIGEEAFGRDVEIEYSDIIRDRKERSLRTFTLPTKS